MKTLLCPSCNKQACSLVNKMTCGRLFPIICKGCGIRLYPTSYFRSIVDVLAFIMIPVVTVWGIELWDSWIPAIVYLGLALTLEFVWKGLSPLNVIDR